MPQGSSAPTAMALSPPSRHVDHVLALVHGDAAAQQVQAPSSQVLASWRRCVQTHGLQPDALKTPQVVTAAELRELICPMEEMVEIARPEVDRLFARLAGLGAIVTLADAGGRQLLLRCPPAQVREVSAAGLHAGSVWLEQSQGTNGIGMCIAERAPLSIMASDHFSVRLVGLSCTVAPVFRAEGEVAAVLNVTTHQPAQEGLHALLREIVTASATRIENLWFERMHGAGLILRLSRFRDFSDLSFEARVALDSAGRIIGATGNAQTLVHGAGPLVGHSSTRVLGIADSEIQLNDRSVELARRDGPALFLKAQAPRLRVSARARGPVVRPTPAHEAPRPHAGLDVIVGQHPELTRQIEVTRRLIDRRLPVLVEGETGTGKSVLARALHDASAHAAGRFVALNCAAIPADLIESELFGYRAGAFTGAAKQGSRGLLLEADGGTLFLDEIGDMPLALQSRLLHVLSGGEFVPIGAVEMVKVSFSLISATLHDLDASVRQGLFREDLYFRLAGTRLQLPPLRLRRDRPQLIMSVFEAECRDAGRTGMRLGGEVMKRLQQHRWPGNLRELQHALRYAVTVCEGDDVDLMCLPKHLAPPAEDAADQAAAPKRESTERMLAQCGWNVSEAANRLGISRATLHRRIQEFALQRPASPSL
jgi:transcriptional regulator of acetoin/glycerol metabolism